MSIIPIILAAGQGTRMKSATPKVLHPVMGKPMIDYILDEVAKVTSLRPIVVAGHGADQVIRAVEGRADIAVQQEQLGTANAVAAAEKDAKGRAENVLVAYADMPCLRAETIRRVSSTLSRIDSGMVPMGAPSSFARVGATVRRRRRARHLRSNGT